MTGERQLEDQREVHGNRVSPTRAAASGP
jgi:hypothetical protein